jgi:hypothetical protein
MGDYLNQSTALFAQMQEQMAKGSASLFGGLPGFPSASRKPGQEG